MRLFNNIFPIRRAEKKRAEFFELVAAKITFWLDRHSAGGETRTLTTCLGSGDFKSPMSTIPSPRRGANLSPNCGTVHAFRHGHVAK